MEAQHLDKANDECHSLLKIELKWPSPREARWPPMCLVAWEGFVWLPGIVFVFAFNTYHIIYVCTVYVDFSV